MKNGLIALDNLELNLSSGNLLLLNIILGTVMFGVALGIRVDDFKAVAKAPLKFTAGLTGQWFILPATTFGLIALLGAHLTPGVAMGMLLIASCPGGNISNFMVHLAKGNTALSVSLTAVSTAGALFITPLNFAAWGWMYSEFLAPMSDNPLLRNLELDAWEVARAIVLLLGLPLILGMGFAHRFPSLAARMERPIRWLSIFAFLAIVGVAFGQNYDAFILHIGAIFGLVALHNTLTIVIGWWWGKAWKLRLRDRRTIGIEMGIQNTGLGLVLLLNPAIFPSHLPIGGMAAITAWWGIWHILSGLSVASWWRKRTAHE